VGAWTSSSVPRRQPGSVPQRRTRMRGGGVLTMEEEECSDSGDLNRFQPALVLGRWTNGGGGG
jgi:hypothetical protein